MLVLCFVERKEFCLQIVSKLGSSFSVVPFVIVVVCTVILLLSYLLNGSKIIELVSSFNQSLFEMLKDLTLVNAGIMYHPSHGRFTACCSTSFFPHSSDQEGKFSYISFLSDSVAY